MPPMKPGHLNEELQNSKSIQIQHFIDSVPFFCNLRIKDMMVYFQNWNYFSESESECVKMMEEVEKLCDRLELTRYAFLTYALFFDL